MDISTNITYTNSLQNISCEIIRQNWLQYTKNKTDEETYKEQIMEYRYNILWESLEKKMNIDNTDRYYCLLKKFIDEHVTTQSFQYDEISSFAKIGVYIEQKDKNTLVIKGLHPKDRKDIHLLCDKIGLYHQSISHPKKKNKRFLHIYFPSQWQWEYTEKNPYSKSDEYYEKREQDRQKKEKEYQEKWSRKYCCLCDRTGLETDLFCSVYIRGLYCNDCLETMSDGDGGVLNDHKFEPLWRR